MNGIIFFYLESVMLFFPFVLSIQRVFESDFVGRRCVVKERFSKKYRHPSLDATLTIKRLNAVSFLHFNDAFSRDH